MHEVPTPSNPHEEIVFDTLAGEALVETQDMSMSDDFRAWLFSFAGELIERLPADVASDLRSLEQGIRLNLRERGVNA